MANGHIGGKLHRDDTTEFDERVQKFINKLIRKDSPRKISSFEVCKMLKPMKLFLCSESSILYDLKFANSYLL